MGAIGHDHGISVDHLQPPRPRHIGQPLQDSLTANTNADFLQYTQCAYSYSRVDLLVVA